MHFDINRVIAQAAGRSVSQKPELKHVVTNVEFPNERISTEENF